jgi:hypothetical protein
MVYSLLRAGLVSALLACGVFAADDVVSAVSGTVKTVDKATKTAVVRPPMEPSTRFILSGEPRRTALKRWPVEPKTRFWV